MAIAMVLADLRFYMDFDEYMDAMKEDSDSKVDEEE